MIATHVNTLGLILDIAGVLGLFKYGLPAYVVRTGHQYLIADDIDQNEVAKGKLYDRNARIALWALIIGFGLQLISNFIPGGPGGPAGWQAVATSFVGLLGFGGVCLTLWYNGRLTRDQADATRQREQERLTEARDHERSVLQRALLAEFRSIRGALQRELEDVNAADPEQEGSILIALVTSPIVDQEINRIGLLTPVQTDKVLDAFNKIKSIARLLPLISRAEQRADFLADVPVEQKPRLERLLGGTIQSLHDAIAALDSSSPK